MNEIETWKYEWKKKIKNDVSMEVKFEWKLKRLEVILDRNIYKNETNMNKNEELWIRLNNW